MLPAGDPRFETNLGDDLKWGNTQLAMLGDFVWEDLNANGIQDANEVDDGINGALVKLLVDTDDDGIPDTQVDQTVREMAFVGLERAAALANPNP